nr:ribonuclease H-like domain-containing protein [Tanacetum cinerariifolium]
GTLSRYKAHLVANGSTQLEGVDVDKTFSPVVKPGLSMVLNRPLELGFSGLHLILLRIVLSQKKYAIEILDRAHMANCNPSRNPIDTESKLGSDDDLVSDQTLYQSLACSLQYLTFTRPDISYAVQQVCIYMHDLREPHFLALKRILQYVHEAEYHGVANVVAETFGYAIYCVSFTLLYLPLHLFTVIMLMPFICPAIRFIISVRSILILLSTAMAGYDLSEACVLKKLNDEKIKGAEKEGSEKCTAHDDEYENASSHSCLCWKFKKDRAISNAVSVKPTEDLVISELKKV